MEEYLAYRITQDREREYASYPCWGAERKRLRIRRPPLLARLWALRPRT